MSNIDRRSADGFDSIWKRQGATKANDFEQAENFQAFESFFSIFPLEEMETAEGFDLGCGAGRIAQFVAPRVGKLHCIDPSPAGLDAAKATMEGLDNVEYHRASVDSIPLADSSQDFGYSLGVLHLVPDPQAGLSSCTAKLKAGAPFLLYIYYAFDNRPAWFRWIWRISDIGRRGVSSLPFPLRARASDLVALTFYWPLSRLSRFLDRRGLDVSNIPLSAYRDSSWATLRADALDRLGTAVEHRFTRNEVEAMMKRAGLAKIRFHKGTPYWVAVGFKARATQDRAKTEA